MDVRPVSLSTHGAAELMFGIATMLAPFLFGFEAAGTVIAVAIGALVAGLGLTTVDERTIRVARHHAYDMAAPLGLIAGAVIAGLAADPVAAAYLAGAAVVHALLNLGTRYTA